MPRKRNYVKKPIFVTPKESSITFSLSTDKSYEVIDKLGNMLFIKNDNGKRIEVSKDLFL